MYGCVAKINRNCCGADSTVLNLDGLLSKGYSNSIEQSLSPSDAGKRNLRDRVVDAMLGLDSEKKAPSDRVKSLCWKLRC